VKDRVKGRKREREGEGERDIGSEEE